MSKPKISVIIPAYNVELYVKDCIQSVLKQTFADFELIIINDGSTDKTGAILDEISSQNNKVKVIHQINNGVSEARNIGIRIATGEYICFVDSDDIITKNMLQQMYDMALESKADVCVCGIESFRDGDTVPELAIKQSYDNFTSLQALELLLYEKRILNSPCAKLYKKITISDIKFDKNIAFGEDMLFNYYVFKNAQAVIVSEFKPYYYLQRSGSTMRKKYNDKRADSLVAAKKIEHDILKNKIEALKKASINKVFTESVSIAGLMPHKLRKTELFLSNLKFIDDNKRDIFKDPKVSKKNKVFSGVTIISKMVLINLLWARNSLRRKIG